MYQLPVRLGDEFDIVYTSRGVLGWLPDIRGWARVVARFVKPGGRFYMSEVHPVLQVFENEGVSPRELRLQYPYWEHGDPLIFDVHGSYADRSADLGTELKEHGWDHGLGEIVTALIDAGLRIERLEEQPVPRVGRRLPGRERAGQRPMGAAGGPGELPLMFSTRGDETRLALLGLPEAEAAPGRPAGRLDQLDEDAVAASAGG